MCSKFLLNSRVGTIAQLGDMMDECIVPMDYVNGKRATLLTDDELFELMIQDLPQDVHLDIIMDCCHSGSGADLEWGWEGKNGWVRHSTKPARGGRVVCISGCEDAQLSTETNAFDGEPRGALTLVIALNFGRLPPQPHQIVLWL